MRKRCIKNACVMSGIEVDTDKDECIVCGSTLSTPLGGLLGGPFGNVGTKGF